MLHGIKIAALGNKPVIAIGGGRLVTEGGDIGAGHITPARGISEAVRAHPDVKKGKVLVQTVLPHNWQLNTPINLLPHRDLTVTSGFSGLPGDGGLSEVYEVIQNPVANARYRQMTNMPYTGRHIKFIPDTRRSLQISQYPELSGVGLRRAWRLAQGQFTPSAITFGEPGSSLLRHAGNAVFGLPFYHSSDISPALTDEALEAMRESIHNPAQAKDVYSKFMRYLQEEGGNPEAAEYIRRGLLAADRGGKPYRPILLTGSSRGDFVAQRTMELDSLLRRHNLQGQFHPVPILGKNVDVTGRILQGTQLPRIADVPQGLYNSLRGAAAVNIASTGAGDLNELKGLGAPSLFDANQELIQNRELANPRLAGITSAQRNKLQQIKTYSWNKGAIQDIGHTSPQGMATYTNLDELVAKLKDPAFMDRKANLARAARYHRSAVVHKSRLGSALVEEAQRVARGSVPRAGGIVHALGNGLRRLARR